MIFFLQQLQRRIVEQPHPFVGLGCGSKERAERTKNAECTERRQEAGRAAHMKSQLNLRLGEFHRIFASALERTQAVNDVQIPILTFKM
jgi:hypothetical protein